MTIKIGITGGIGAGKSVVTKIFGILGIPTYDADTRAKVLMEHDSNLIANIKMHFGQASYHLGKLDRRYLAEQVFNDQSNIEILNQLVHPAVGDDFERWVTQNKDAPYIIKEAALLVESGSYRSLDKLVVVEAPEKTRIERVLKRDPQRSREEVVSIISKQLSSEERRSFADYLIQNDGKLSLVQQVMRIHESIVGEANS